MQATSKSCVRLSSGKRATGNSYGGGKAVAVRCLGSSLSLAFDGDSEGQWGKAAPVLCAQCSSQPRWEFCHHSHRRLSVSVRYGVLGAASIGHGHLKHSPDLDRDIAAAADECFRARYRGDTGPYPGSDGQLRRGRIASSSTDRLLPGPLRRSRTRTEARRFWQHGGRLTVS